MGVDAVLVGEGDADVEMSKFGERLKGICACNLVDMQIWLHFGVWNR